MHLPILLSQSGSASLRSTTRDGDRVVPGLVARRGWPLHCFWTEIYQKVNHAARRITKMWSQAMWINNEEVLWDSRFIYGLFVRRKALLCNNGLNGKLTALAGLDTICSRLWSLAAIYHQPKRLHTICHQPLKHRRNQPEPVGRGHTSNHLSLRNRKQASSGSCTTDTWLKPLVRNNISTTYRSSTFMASSEGKYVCLQIEFDHSNWYWTRQGQGQKSVPVSDAGLWCLMVPAGRSLLSSVNFLITYFSSIKFTSSKDEVVCGQDALVSASLSARSRSKDLTANMAATCWVYWSLGGWQPLADLDYPGCWAVSQLCSERATGSSHKLFVLHQWLKHCDN